MLLREVQYARPKTVEEAVGLLSTHDGARALAGGQTLVNVMKARAASPDVLVDLQDIDELRGVRDLGQGSVQIGAMTTYSQLTSDEAGARSILGEVASTIADVQVRNRGTIGGNVCSNDPTNHLPPLLVALDASFTIVGPAGAERTVSADEFFVGVYMTAAGPGELLTTITIPPGGQDGFAAVTIGRHGTGIVTTAASLNGGARIAIGCVDAVPVRARQMEERVGLDFSDANVRAAAEGLGATLDPPGDVHASADYRRRLAEVLAARAVIAARERR
jgi:aerobic carbon-monoxide dehydrogenase medium subunit